MSFIMHIPNQITNYKSLLIATGLILAAVALVISLVAPAARAASLTSVSSNIAAVPDGETLVLRVAAQNQDNVHELEVDHSLQGTLPEFSVYANEANPYGTSEADFVANGVTVTYSAANSEWTIDFGRTVTDIIIDNGGDVQFYFVLRDASRNILWGSMDTVTPENTFTFDLIEGTGDSFVAEDTEEVVVPGVPNTSVSF